MIGFARTTDYSPNVCINHLNNRLNSGTFSLVVSLEGCGSRRFDIRHRVLAARENFPFYAPLHYLKWPRPFLNCSPRACASAKFHEFLKDLKDHRILRPQVITTCNCPTQLGQMRYNRLSRQSLVSTERTHTHTNRRARVRTYTRRSFRFLHIKREEIQKGFRIHSTVSRTRIRPLHFRLFPFPFLFLFFFSFFKL